MNHFSCGTEGLQPLSSLPFTVVSFSPSSGKAMEESGQPKLRKNHYGFFVGAGAAGCELVGGCDED